MTNPATQGWGEPYVLQPRSWEALACNPHTPPQATNLGGWHLCSAYSPKQALPLGLWSPVLG